MQARFRQKVMRVHINPITKVTWLALVDRMKGRIKVLFHEVFMSVAHDEILKSALSLPEADRILLATEILHSIAEPMPGMSFDDPKLVEELHRRRASMDDSISASDLFCRLDELLRK